MAGIGGFDDPGLGIQDYCVTWGNWLIMSPDSHFVLVQIGGINGALAGTRTQFDTQS